jgi:voltage-gated potassium channel
MAAESIGTARGSGTPAYQMFMLALCVLALLAVVLQNFFALDRDVEKVLQLADTAICVVFFIDFLVTLYRAPNRWRYLYTWGWLDLISSIPTLDAARWGRLARLARLIRVLRAFRAARLFTKILSGEKAKSTTLGATMLAFLLVIGGSTAVLYFENAPESNIKSAEDAVWWSMVTLTTVGYGDRFPVSTGGRIVAVLLMTAGVGLFGTMSAALAAWFITGNQKEEEQQGPSEVALLREEIAALRDAVEQLRKEPGR